MERRTVQSVLNVGTKTRSAEYSASRVFVMAFPPYEGSVAPLLSRLMSRLVGRKAQPCVERRFSERHSLSAQRSGGAARGDPLAVQLKLRHDDASNMATTAAQ